MPTKQDAIEAALHADWQKAIIINKVLLKENPHNIDALNRLGFAYLSTGEIKKAKTSFDKVLKIDPFNPIALKNIKKIKNKNVSSNNGVMSISPKIFLEEPGITKTVQLVNLAPKAVITSLHCGQRITYLIKKNKIEIRTLENVYIGILPDDLSFKLKRLSRLGNKYEMFIKSVEDASVSVLIREIKRGKRVKDATFVNKALPDYHSSIRSELLEGVLDEEEVESKISDDESPSEAESDDEDEE